MSEWQPISTAPTGVDVLLAATDEDGSNWQAVGQWWVGRWIASGIAEDAPVFLVFEPTHWMPLPSPPTKQEEQGK